MSAAQAEIAVIGGSGLYDIDGLENVRRVDIDTPFGSPSDTVVLGELSGVSVAFLPRHGRGHRFNPTHIPVRANIYALKTLGVEKVISVSAVGSLKEEFAPLDLVIPSQLIDRTRLRDSTFFDEHIVVHVGIADPFCAPISQAVHRVAQAMDVNVHPGGTMVVMEGPAFSTRAESFMYRSWGADIIGMTALPEAKLAREAEMCYATLAWITDYDVWRANTEEVSVEAVVQNLLKNVATSREMLTRLMPAISGQHDCACGTSLKDAIITAPDRIPDDLKKRLSPIIGKYVG